jgi:transposase
VAKVDFPPYSPDLNPIENLWNSMAREVEKYQCESVEDLMKAVELEWEAVSKEELEHLVESMPRRCSAVIEAKGCHTKY